ncbi:glycerol-3-phosphate dehydrogenase [Legionella sp. CNM-4043-24]|uniref:glycerol-3-phosphate dehydrogenase n=1 Tax=Legionella sp. CNM-4043-24 TaxID=3421646 RepID=UPI00403B157E
MDKCFDVAVIGGGINGCGIAADASMRGLSVVLLEMDDLASKTSSSSTKLIHGGLRYLEMFNFSLVKKALNERQILMEQAPYLVFPRPFVLPLKRSLRPTLLIRAGLFIYDHLSRRNTLPHSRHINREKDSLCFSPLKEELNKGFIYYDCCADDARLTISNALQARHYGASIRPQTKVLSAQVIDGIWHLHCQDASGATCILRSRSLINATGPWVESLARQAGIASEYHISLVKGSHLVVPRLYQGEHAYLLQHDDKRVIFVIPWHGYSMIGTTDVLFSESPDEINISGQEIDYLLNLVNSYFKQPLTRDNIITTWSGVRPLLASKDKSPQAMSRDYVFHFSDDPAPSVTVYGGKITTYRQLARDCVDRLRVLFPGLGDSITSTTALPGAAWTNGSYADYRSYAREHYLWLDTDIMERYLSTYGTRTEHLIASCTQMKDLGIDFGHGLFQREVDYLVAEEWARDCDDILLRRTRLGLGFDAEERQKLKDYVDGLARHNI